MGKMTNPSYLKEKQYQSSINLNCRIALHEKFSTNPMRWAEWIYQHLALQPGMRVLAVGCGNATQWCENASRFPSKAQFVLTDLSIGMLRDAKKCIGHEDHRFNYLTGDAQFLPINETKFDRVTANHMLYHVPSIEKALGECARVIKPEGVFMAATNGYQHMIELYELLMDFDSDLIMPEKSNRRFGLRNGADMISRHFNEVHRKFFDCDLWVTDADALVNYAFSMWDVKDTIAMERAAALHTYFDAFIQKDGGIRIRKETGLFLASHTAGLIESLGILQTQ